MIIDDRLRRIRRFIIFIIFIKIFHISIISIIIINNKASVGNQKAKIKTGEGASLFSV